jgi:hypothetical protein
MRAHDNIVPLHRGVRPIPARDLQAIFQPIDYDPAEQADDLAPGLLDAVAEFISDPRFIAGAYVGMAFVCVTAFVVAF